MQTNIKEIEIMTKEEAIAAMKDGKKVSHRLFTSDEWMKIKGSRYEFEDGCSCNPNEFWSRRIHASWDSNWSIV